MLFVCNRKVIYYYYITLPSITITITITFGNFQSITITITGKSGYYILQLHITYYYYPIPAEQCLAHLGVREATDLIGLGSVSGGGGGSHRLALCQGPRSCRARKMQGVLIGWHCAKVQGHAELEIEKPRVKTLSYDFPKLQNSKTNSFCANVHLRQSF